MGFSRFFSKFKERAAGRSGGVVRPGGDGVEPVKEFPGEKTANWSSAGPASKPPFNTTTRWPVVKTRAAKQGVD